MGTLIENLREIYKSVFKFPWSHREDYKPLIDLEIDSIHSPHQMIEYWEIENKVTKAKEYFTVHISKGVYWKLRRINREEPSFENIIIDIDTPSLKSSFTILKKVSKIISKTGLKIDIDYFVKYSGNKGFHLIIPYWKLKDIDNKLFILWLKDNLKAYGKFIDWHILLSKYHLVRDFWSYNSKSGLVSIYINEDFLMSIKDTSNFFKNVASPTNKEEILLLSDKLKESFNFDEPNFRDDFVSKLEIYKSKEELFKELHSINNKKKFNNKSIKIKKGIFPKKVREILENGIQKDGRERFLFLLATICKANNYTYEEFENLVKQWNEKNYRKDEKDWQRWLKTLEQQMKWYKKNWDNFKYKIPKKEKFLYWSVE